ncbi:MAG: right-handed parallel beta-helix repeat-containing protein [Lachnospiraceae bacterium]|nr:right-handed parallel beta-helix repeat-containing protein [Lachnospiraceae bacterium]
MVKTYHVSKSGNDRNTGMAESPFLTIQRAAEAANVGDTVIVHEGEYREWVKPRLGGRSHTQRITYMAAEGEHVVIKGSEQITDWEPVEGTVWKAVILNELFGDYNPFAIPLTGDWVVEPYDNPVHLGDVYLNGKSFYEAQDLNGVLHPQRLEVSPNPTWRRREEKLLEPERSVYRWYAEVFEETTVVYANFHEYNPNQELVEVNVRRSCFYPEKTGIDYITVRGFEMAQAASPWAPPTADQPGLLGPNWSKGWIIENNRIHDAKCVGISLGKEASTGDNAYTKWNIKPGYQTQMEAVFRALYIGWSKETIGSHIVRNNVIHDCGQAGIVGHMGCVFSEIYDNEIYAISKKHEFYGHELGGIKLHAAIDVQIRHNYIHDCSLGLWLDWQAQGTRVSRNIFTDNNRDLFIEVTHGPCLVDNNIFADAFALVNAAQGTAYVHNLVCGFMQHYGVLNRATPYHFPHSTQPLGTTCVYGNDDRWYQNIFVGGTEEEEHYGTADYDGAPTSLDEYVERVKANGHGDVQLFMKERQPVYINSNAYFNGAKAFDREEEKLVSEVSLDVSFSKETDGLYMEFTLPEEAFKITTQIMTTKLLAETRLTEEHYENPDGSSLAVDFDLNGETRSKKPVVGPLEGLKPGKNRVKIWER